MKNALCATFRISKLLLQEVAKDILPHIPGRDAPEGTGMDQGSLIDHV